MRYLSKSVCMKILALLCIDSILGGIISLVDSILTFVYLTYRIDFLTATAIGVPLVFIAMGIISLLPLAEYAYIRQGYINPAIARDSQRAYEEWRTEKRQTGLLILFSAIFIVLLNPYGILLGRLLPPSLNSTLVPAVVHAFLTILIAAVYKKWLQKHFDLTGMIKRLRAAL